MPSAAVPVTIRPVTPTDRGAWESLFLAYGVFYDEQFSPEVVAGVWAWLVDPDHDVTGLVAELDGEAVGFAHYRRIWDTFTAGPAWFLDDLFTTPDARGHGIGTALIEGIAERIGGGKLSWITAADNATAQHVYDRLATRTSWVTYELGPA